MITEILNVGPVCTLADFVADTRATKIPIVWFQVPSFEVVNLIVVCTKKYSAKSAKK